MCKQPGRRTWATEHEKRKKGKSRQSVVFVRGGGPDAYYAGEVLFYFICFALQWLSFAVAVVGELGVVHLRGYPVLFCAWLGLESLIWAYVALVHRRAIK